MEAPEQNDGGSVMVDDDEISKMKSVPTPSIWFDPLPPTPEAIIKTENHHWHRSDYPEDLFPVGKVVRASDNGHTSSSRDPILLVSVATFLIDLYRISPWWLKVCNVKDSESPMPHRSVLLLQAIPLGSGSGTTIINPTMNTALECMQMDSHGRIVFHDFTTVVVKLVCSPSAWHENDFKSRFPPNGEGNSNLAELVRGGTVYTQREAAAAVREWTLEENV